MVELKGLGEFRLRKVRLKRRLTSRGTVRWVGLIP